MPVLRLKLKNPGLWWARWKISSCGSRHHPVCRGCKSGNRCIHGYRCLFRHADGNKETQSEVEKNKGSQGSVPILKEKKRPRLCISNSDHMNSIPRKAEELGLNASAGHTMKFLVCTWNKNWIRKKKRQSGGIIQKGEPVTLVSEILARPVLRRNTWRNLTTSRLYQQNSVELGEKIYKLKADNYVFSSFFVNAPETQKIVCLWRIRELQCTMLSREICAQIQWILWECPKPPLLSPICDLPRAGAVQINE